MISLFIPSMLIAFAWGSVGVLAYYGVLPVYSHEFVVDGVFITSLSQTTQFLLIPVVLLLALYLISKQVNVDILRDYPSVISSLFLGGLIGDFVPYIVVVYAARLPFASILHVPSVLLTFGLMILFPGFFAVALASFRNNQSKVQR